MLKFSFYYLLYFQKLLKLISKKIFEPFQLPKAVISQ